MDFVFHRKSRKFHLKSQELTTFFIANRCHIGKTELSNLAMATVAFKIVMKTSKVGSSSLSLLSYF